MTSMDAIRKKLEPVVRAHGIKPAADAVGVSNASVHRWLAGNASLSFEKVQQLAGVLGYKLTVEYKLKKKGR